MRATAMLGDTNAMVLAAAKAAVANSLWKGSVDVERCQANSYLYFCPSYHQNCVHNFFYVMIHKVFEVYLCSLAKFYPPVLIAETLTCIISFLVYPK